MHEDYAEKKQGYTLHGLHPHIMEGPIDSKSYLSLLETMYDIWLKKYTL